MERAKYPGPSPKPGPSAACLELALGGGFRKGATTGFGAVSGCCMQGGSAAAAVGAATSGASLKLTCRRVLARGAPAAAVAVPLVGLASAAAGARASDDRLPPAAALEPTSGAGGPNGMTNMQMSA